MVSPIVQTILRIINVYHLHLKDKKIAVISSMKQGSQLHAELVKAFNYFGSINNTEEERKYHPEKIDLIDEKLETRVEGGYDYTFIVNGGSLRFFPTAFSDIREIIDEGKFNLGDKKLFMISGNVAALQKATENIRLSDILEEDTEVVEDRTNTDIRAKGETYSSDTFPYYVVRCELLGAKATERLASEAL